MFCTITPDRGEPERAELLEFCKYQLSRMTVKPEKSYFIDYPPTSKDVDLVERVRHGVELAKQDGFEYAFIIESDDAYPADYFSKFDIGKYLFYGSEETWYYNIRSRTYNDFKHPLRSSLFTTGFNIGALSGFNWYAPRNRFLDVSLWSYAENSPTQFVYTGAIGIKHNLGLCAGKGHVQLGKHSDNDLQWLKANTDKEQFDFYTKMTDKLC